MNRPKCTYAVVVVVTRRGVECRYTSKVSAISMDIAVDYAVHSVSYTLRCTEAELTGVFVQKL